MIGLLSKREDDVISSSRLAYIYLTHFSLLLREIYQRTRVRGVEDVTCGSGDIAGGDGAIGIYPAVDILALHLSHS